MGALGRALLRQAVQTFFRASRAGQVAVAVGVGMDVEFMGQSVIKRTYHPSASHPLHTVGTPQKPYELPNLPQFDRGTSTQRVMEAHT